VRYHAAATRSRAQHAGSFAHARSGAGCADHFDYQKCLEAKGGIAARNYNEHTFLLIIEPRAVQCGSVELRLRFCRSAQPTARWSNFLGQEVPSAACEADARIFNVMRYVRTVAHRKGKLHPLLIRFVATNAI
jgi:hypothetical protein